MSNFKQLDFVKFAGFAQGEAPAQDGGRMGFSRPSAKQDADLSPRLTIIGKSRHSAGAFRGLTPWPARHCELTGLERHETLTHLKTRSAVALSNVGQGMSRV